MPRTPAPHTVEYSASRDAWLVLDKTGYEYGGRNVASFVEEADARAFVALPALQEALRDLLDVISADDLVPESVSYMRQARAALAQADGPAPKE